MSDAVFELHGACVHSLRFSFAAPVDYPYAPAEVAVDGPPPALFRRVQAVSPPPTRVGAPWQSGMTLDGKPFDPSGPLDRLAEVENTEGTGNLDTPEPETVVLDWMFDVPRDEQHPVSIPGHDQGRYLLSVPYWNPAEVAGRAVTKTVDYFATHRVDWNGTPQSDWVAVSFDDFAPKDRDSADVLIPLGACDDHCPSS
ncbi:hypothetical protein [Actinoplanes sp. GCM10030250]|uniref:hypothetical protein n=1 Tax=Actinoplanes sp. GCM10030250 TaxID=3273376 RepID=UPI0036108A95